LFTFFDLEKHFHIEFIKIFFSLRKALSDFIMSFFDWKCPRWLEWVNIVYV